MTVQKPNMKKNINAELKTSMGRNEYVERQKVLAAQTANRELMNPNAYLHEPQLHPQPMQGLSQMYQFQQNAFQNNFTFQQPVDFTATPNALVNEEDLSIRDDLAELLSTMDHGQYVHTLCEIYGIKYIAQALQSASNVHLVLGDAAKQSQNIIKGILNAVKENVIQAIGEKDQTATKNIGERIDAFFIAYVKVCEKVIVRQEAQRALMECLGQQTHYEQHLYFRDIFQRQTQELYGRYGMTNEDVEQAFPQQQQQATQAQPDQAESDKE